MQKTVTLENFNAPPFRINNKDVNSIQATFGFSELTFSEIETVTEHFVSLQVDGFGKTYEPGSPDLPYYIQLISVPKEVNLQLELGSHAEQSLVLREHQINFPIVPALASASKSDAKDLRYFKGKVYQENKFHEKPVVQLKELGIMRNAKIYEITYHPFLYNAVSNELKIRNNAKVKLIWDKQIQELKSWNFTHPLKSAAIENTLSATENQREVFVIVAPLKFETSLHDFIHWKEQQGFQVIEGYVGREIENNTTISIRNFLEPLYTNPQTGMAASSYLLIVGDVSEIPAWNGVTSAHATDLYYAEYTDDFFPEIKYGRFSVTTEEQLQAVIAKTMYVEQGAGSDGAYQNKHLLISGEDSKYAPTHGNGALNYYLANYATSVFGIEPAYYLYGSGSPVLSESPQAKQDILNHFNQGVGYAYYTAHCDQLGWNNPEFLLSDIPSLSNLGYYPLMIGNCCQSLKYNVTSFGEEIVRVPEKGAVAYIGASNDSYWDEDYFWSVGFTDKIVSNPEYESTGLGSWDAWFHNHNEAEELHALTASQIIYSGNMAVQASTSNLKDYYWEIYALMGDPSLVPAKFRYQKLPVAYNPVFKLGQQSLQVSAAPGSTFTLFENENFMGFAKTDALGVAQISFKALSQTGEKIIRLTATHPEYLPAIDSLSCIPADGPYVVFDSVFWVDSLGNPISSVNYGESIGAFLQFKNYGNQDATDITIEVNSESTWLVEFTNSNMTIPEIKSGASFTSTEPITFTVSNTIPDAELLYFEGLVLHQPNHQAGFGFFIPVNAPVLALHDFHIDQSGSGNHNGIIDAGELFTLDVEFVNTGHAQVSNTLIQWTSSNPDNLEVIEYENALGGFAVDSTVQMQVVLQGGMDFFPGEDLTLSYHILAGDPTSYQFSGSIPLVLGQEPVISMQNSRDTVVNAYFYDSGGPSGNYARLDTLTHTFVPYHTGEGLAVDFIEFDVESSSTGCFDRLEIYDGLTIDDPLLGSFCSNNMVDQVQSSNVDGALTFRFISDNSAEKAGWEAHLFSSPQHSLTFEISDGAEAEILLDHRLMMADAAGTATFDYTLSEGEKEYTIKKAGYFTQSGKISKLSSDSTIQLVLEKLPDVEFFIQLAGEPLENVPVIFDERTLYTNENGLAVFDQVLSGTKVYVVSLDGFVEVTGAVVVGKTNVSQTVNLEPKTYTVNFTIKNGDFNLADAYITVFDTSLATSIYGQASLDGILPQSAIQFSVLKDGFNAYQGAFDVIAADVSVEVDLTPVGISERFTKAIKVFPNPVSKSGELKISAEREISQLILYSHSGIMLHNEKISAKEFVFNVTNHSPGMYMLKIRLSDEWFYKKMLIE
ncbi:MAG: C25 family cysteine peptidase [Salinivirgaceae bacterium]